MSLKNISMFLVALSLASCCKMTRLDNSFSDKKATLATQEEAIEMSYEKEEKVIYFGKSSFTLDTKSELVLDEKVLGWLKENSKIKVVVEGHCDERGTAAYNKKLGKKRAEAVKKYLVKNGIESSRIKVVSHGFSKPVDTGHDESAWEKNRRAVTIKEIKK
jgi:peptidoglycan-associated lipoprotein